MEGKQNNSQEIDQETDYEEQVSSSYSCSYLIFIFFSFMKYCDRVAILNEEFVL